MTIGYSDNHLLRALSAICADLKGQTSVIEMPLGLLQSAGDARTVAYFPVSAMLSVQQLLADGYVTEIASVGSEGMTGVADCLAMRNFPSAQIVVSLPGWGYRLDINILQETLHQSDRLRMLLLRYLSSQLTQLIHQHTCAGHHHTDQRVCCWLLYTAVRRKCDDIEITQEILGNILGVRRESITQVLCRLREQGVLRTRRGRLSVLNFGELLRQSCECYGLLRSELNLLMSVLEREFPSPSAGHHLLQGGHAKQSVSQRC